MPKIDVASVPERKGSGYPPPYDEAAKDRVRRRLGDAGGLTDFGVNLLQLPPGAWSSQRHWHSHEDEFVYVLSAKSCSSRMRRTDLARRRLRGVSEEQS